MVRKSLIAILLFFTNSLSQAQLKFIVDDFEGLSEGQTDLKEEGVFTYGGAVKSVDKKMTTGYGYSGQAALKITWTGKEDYRGWGKGVGANVELDAQQDYLNFYVYSSKSNGKYSTMKILLEEDDNGNSSFEKEHDDSWNYILTIENSGSWKIISLPLKDFKDGNEGGDGIFNVNYREGKLCTFIVRFLDTLQINETRVCYFDFISFSKGVLPVGSDLFNPPPVKKQDFCVLGAWSEEGNSGNLMEIANGFESNFKKDSNKKLGIVHFFKPFSIGGGKSKTLYPNIDKLNELIENGYTPMITLEDHFVNVNKNHEQPGLKSIVDGHFDYLFTEWAKRLKEVKGIVLLRILHEFNGNWYPWCIANNNKDPKLYIKTYQHIRNLFNKEHADNVKFIWCPNSISSPQKSWNFVLDAYPGNEYVDFVGIDVYNGTGGGKAPVLWRSFRKEAIESYFLLTENFPDKPLLICETSSREREGDEKANMYDKAQWISQMSEALKTDMSKVRLIAWFNEKEKYKVNSSYSSKVAFLKNIWTDSYFKSDASILFQKEENK